MPSTHPDTTTRFSTFAVAGRLYGIEVKRVQEIVKPMPMTRIPLAPDHIHGLINLRGQIATALGLRELFGIGSEAPEEMMNVICQSDGTLISFLVDEIGDVLDVDPSTFEPTPESVPEGVRQFLEGIYKLPGALLSIIDVESVMAYVNAHQKA